MIGKKINKKMGKKDICPMHQTILWNTRIQNTVNMRIEKFLAFDNFLGTHDTLLGYKSDVGNFL